MSYNVTGEPATGGAIVNPDGTFTYTPSGTSHAATTDTFTVTITDGHGGSTPISVSVPVAQAGTENGAPQNLNPEVG